MEETFDVTKYPEGKERLKEMLDFLPEIDEVREEFLDMIIFRMLFAT